VVYVASMLAINAGYSTRSRPSWGTTAFRSSPYRPGRLRPTARTITSSDQSGVRPLKLGNRSNWDRELENRASQRTKSGGGGNGAGETLAGAVLGGLLGGPFGT
jgi:hypothetical protein